MDYGSRILVQPNVSRIPKPKETVKAKLEKLNKLPKPAVNSGYFGKENPIGSILETTADMSPRLLAGITGDSYIGTTGFELGENVQEYFDKCLDSNANIWKELDFDAQALRKKLEFSVSQSKEFESLIERNLKKFKDFNKAGPDADPEGLVKDLRAEAIAFTRQQAKKTLDRVKALKKGEVVLINSGWMERGVLSTVLIEVKKTGEGQYIFGIYNKGNGLEYHPSIVDGLKEKFQTHVEYKNVDKNKILSIGLYQSLFEMQVLSSFDQMFSTNTKTSFSAEVIYKGILKLLKGKRVEVSDKPFSFESPSRVLLPRRWKTLMMLVRSECKDEKQYRRVKHFLWFKAHKDFLQTMKKGKHEFSDSQAKAKYYQQSLNVLMDFSTDKYGRSLQKSFDRGWISNDELREATQLIAEIKKQKKVIESDIKSTCVKEANAQQKLPKPDLSVSTLDLPKDQISSAWNLYSSYKIKPKEFSESKVDLKGVKDSKELISQLKTLYVDCKHFAQSTECSSFKALDLIAEKFVDLEVPSKSKETIWNQVPDDQIEDTVKLLLDYSRLIFSTGYLTQGSIDPKSLVNYYHCLSIIDYLNKRSSKSALPKDADVYVEGFNSFNEAIGFILPTAKHQMQFDQIRGYLVDSPERDASSLFKYTSGETNSLRLVFRKKANNLKRYSGFIGRDYDVVVKLLDDPKVQEKLTKNKITDRRRQFLALTADLGEYLPKVDAALKEASLMARRLISVATPVRGQARFLATNTDQTMSLKIEETDVNSIFLSDPVDRIQVLCDQNPIDNGFSTSRKVFVASDHYDADSIDLDFRPSETKALWSKRFQYDFKYNRKVEREKKKKEEQKIPSTNEETTFWAGELAYALSDQNKVNPQANIYKDPTLNDEKESANDVVANLGRFQSAGDIDRQDWLDIHLSNVNSREGDTAFRILRFLEKNKSMILKDKSIQNILLAMINKGPILQAIESNHEELVDKYKEFFIRSYEFHRGREETDEAAFAVLFLKRFEDAYVDIHNEKKIFSDVNHEKLLSDLLKEQKIPSKKTAILRAMVCLSYHDSVLGKVKVDEAFALKYFRALIYSSNHPVKEGYDFENRLLDNEIKIMKEIHGNNLLKLLKDPTVRENILNAIAQDFAFKKCQWRGKFPEFEGNDLIIDLLSGSIATKKDKQHVIDKGILVEALREYGVADDESSLVMSSSGWLSNKAQTLKVKAIKKGYYESGYKVVVREKRGANWFQVEKISKFANLKHMLEEVGIHDLHRVYTPIQSNSIVNLAGIFSNTIELIVEKQEDKTPITITVDPDTGTIERIQKKIGQEDFVLAKPEPNDSICQFFDSDSLVIWQSTTSGRRFVEAQGGVLTFEFDPSTKKYKSMNFPGFELATPNSKSFNGHMEYIHFVNEKTGQHKAVLFTLEYSDQGINLQQHLEGKLPPSLFPILNRSFDAKFALNVYNLDKDLKPEIKKTSDALPLANIYLANKNYIEAHKFLLQAEALGKYEENSLKILNDIVKIPDSHPDALNIRMRALCMLKKNQVLNRGKITNIAEHINQNKERFIQEVQTLYMQYLYSAGKGKLEKLPTQLERIVWAFVDVKNWKKEELLKVPSYLLLLRYADLILNEKPDAKQLGKFRFNDERYKLEKLINEIQDTVAGAGQVPNINAYKFLTKEQFDKALQEQSKAYYSTVNKDQRPSGRDLSEIPYLGSNDEFKQHFLSLYKSARSKKLSDVEIERLTYMSGDNNYENKILAEALLIANQFPSSFPRLKELKKIEEKLGDSSFYSTYDISFYVERILKESNKFTKGFKRLGKDFKEVIKTYVSSKINETFYIPKSMNAYEGSSVKERPTGHSDTDPYRSISEEMTKPLTLSLKPVNLSEKTLTKIEEVKKSDLVAKRQKAQDDLEKLEKIALDLANKLPVKGKEIVELNRQTGLEKLLTIEDLTSLFIIGNRERYTKQTYLSQKEIDALDTTVGEYLQKKSLEQHLSQCLSAYNKYESLNSKSVDDKNYFGAKVLSLVNETNQFDINKERGYLAFQGITGMRLRDVQVQNLAKLNKKDRIHVILHMIMGAGKSTVITPIWALEKASGDKLPFVIVPDSLYKTGKETTKSTVYKAFGKFAHAFEFERSSDFSSTKLENMYLSLEKWNADSGFVYATKEGILSFLLKAKETFYNYEEASNDSERNEFKLQLEYAWKIINYLKKNTVGLCDEAHELLNCRNELNFTFGQPEAIKKKYSTHVFEIVHLLATDKELKAVIDLDHNNQAKMTKEQYEKNVKPKLVQHFMKKFKLKGDDVKYFENELSSVPDSIKKHADRDNIAISKALVTVFLPHTLNKKVDENFGLGSKKSFAIPFLGNNTPNEKAEFANFLETLLYTGYYYLQKKLTSEQVKKVVDQLQHEAKREQIVNKKRLEETEAYKFFQKTFNQHLLNKIDYKKVEQMINSDPKRILEAIERVVVPDIDFYPKKLSANPHTLTNLFQFLQGMTGTPWNKESFSSVFKTYVDPQVDKKSEEIILGVNGYNKPSYHSLKVDTPKNQLEAIVDQLISIKGARAIIDSGALIKGVTNYEVAEMMLNKSSAATIDGVIYYDSQNELKVLERASKKSVLLSESELSKERLLTYYDQRHTLGSDIPQFHKAEALVTVSETLMKYKLYQAMWRFREIDKNQKLHFIVPQDVEKLVSSSGHMTGKNLVEFVSRNENYQIRQDNFRSRKLEMHSIVEGAIHSALAESVNFEQRYMTFKKVKTLLFQNLQIDPYRNFGKIESDEKVEVLLQEYADKCIKTLEKLSRDGVIYNKRELETQIQKLTKRNISFDDKYSSRKGDSDTQVEKQVELEVNIEIETKPDDNVKSVLPWKTWGWDKDCDIYNESWIRTQRVPSSYSDSRIARTYRKVKRIASFVFHVIKFFALTAHQTFYENYKVYARVSDTIINAYKFVKEKFKSIAKFFLRGFYYYFSNCPIYTYDNLLAKAKNQKVAGVGKVFDQNFLVSNNSIQRKLKSALEEQVEPFSVFHKPIYHMLVVEEKGKIKTMIIDQEDFKYFKAKLDEDKKKPADAKRSRKICIVDPAIGITHQGQNKFDEKELMKNDQFIKHQVYALFLSGEVSYTEDQSIVLEDWIRKAGVDKMHTLFKEVCRNKKKSKKSFGSSVISGVFEKLYREKAAKEIAQAAE